ncbi:hypothetical protein [Burkholderia stabilis]
MDSAKQDYVRFLHWLQDSQLGVGEQAQCFTNWDADEGWDGEKRT